MKRKVIVTARFETAEELAPHLEARLREPLDVACKLLEVKTDGKQIPQSPDNAVEADGGRGRADEGAGLGAEALRVEDGAEPLGGRSDDGTEGSVLRAEVGDLTDYASTLDETSAPKKPKTSRR